VLSSPSIRDKRQMALDRQLSSLPRAARPRKDFLCRRLRTAVSRSPAGESRCFTPGQPVFARAGLVARFIPRLD
jgi:hypothetical protein